MNEFDIKASGWDLNPMHLERSRAVVSALLKQIPLNKEMSVMEYGAGTAITSFLLKEHVSNITMMDSSQEMVKIMQEKISDANADKMKAIRFDLESEEWKENRFDLIITQMVLHHVSDTENIIRKFHSLLNQAGYLAIADLYPEDGSFHGEGFSGHKGFDPESLSLLIRRTGFADIKTDKCFVISKKINETTVKEFDVFLITAART